MMHFFTLLVFYFFYFIFHCSMSLHFRLLSLGLCVVVLFFFPPCLPMLFFIIPFSPLFYLLLSIDRCRSLSLPKPGCARGCI